MSLCLTSYRSSSDDVEKCLSAKQRKLRNCVHFSSYIRRSEYPQQTFAYFLKLSLKLGTTSLIALAVKLHHILARAIFNSQTVFGGLSFENSFIHLN